MALELSHTHIYHKVWTSPKIISDYIIVLPCTCIQGKIQMLRNKLKENNVTVTKADKGNSTVLLDEEEYIR